MSDQVQTICSIYLPLCKSPWPPYPSIRPQVLVLSVRGPAISCCPECSTQVRCPPSVSRRGSCDPELSPDGALMVVASQEVYP